MKAYRLIVKGAPNAALRAATEHGIIAEVERTHGPQETVLVVSGPARGLASKIVCWFVEPARIVPGEGYPVGTLLYYRKEVTS